MWAPQVAAMVGGFIPSTPVDHQHIALKAVPGSELPREMPCFRDPDNLVYGKSEHGGMVFGGYELDPRSRWEDGVPWEHAAQSLPADWDRFAPLMAGAIRRFPFLADAEAIRLVCHPDAMTPDANPLLGPLPGVRGFWVAAGLSLNGFGGGGGIGRAMAGWITTGDPGVDIGPYRAWRFSDTYRDPGFAAGLARETYSDYYRLRYPYDVDLAGRPHRVSALYGRSQEAGAIFGTKAGWERADYHDPAAGWRRAGRDQAGYGWTRPPWFERVCAEARAVRERAGIIDLSSFGKIAVEGPGALGLLQRVSANDIDRPVGSVVYTQWCDERGGMVADVTVTRLADDRFRVVTGAGYLASEMAWLRAHIEDDDPVVTIRDVSADLATIGLWGPQARDVVTAAGGSADEVGNDAIPPRRAGSFLIGPAPVHAARISYAGELGWELTMTVDWAVAVWDRLRAAGAEPIGYRAIESLRMEKGYRYYGTDLTMQDTPFDAGMGAFVRLAKGPFVGRDALVEAHVAEPERRLRTLLIGGADYEPIYGGEAVRLDGEVVSRLRSVAYGPTVERTIGYAYLPASTPAGAAVEIDVFDRRVGAVIGPDASVDPTGDRMRG
jgi:4-methylaminobutanoate oxidase (formaldehyde-forming)